MPESGVDSDEELSWEAQVVYICTGACTGGLFFPFSSVPMSTKTLFNFLPFWVSSNYSWSPIQFWNT